MTLSLISSTSTLLRETVEEFDFDNPPTDPAELAKDLLEFMNERNALGLAAPQVGLPFRVFAMRGTPNYVCYNPRIVDASPTLVTLEEGCLTFPNLILPIERPRAIRARFSTPGGNVVTVKFEGLTARIYQHELDHLNGILFTDHVSKLKLEIQRKKARKGTI